MHSRWLNKEVHDSIFKLVREVKKAEMWEVSVQQREREKDFYWLARQIELKGCAAG